MSRSLRLALTTIIGLAFVFLIAAAVHASPAKKHECQNVRKCREAITWNHSVVVSLNARLAIADGMTPGGRAAPVCHTTEVCRLDLRRQRAARIWAEGAWQRLITDESPTGERRAIRYIFHPCGQRAVDEGMEIVGWESQYDRFNVNGAGDTGWWQFELPAHPDITVAEAEDTWWSTQRAERDSSCGTNWSPEWTTAEAHGLA